MNSLFVCVFCKEEEKNKWKKSAEEESNGVLSWLSKPGTSCSPSTCPVDASQGGYATESEQFHQWAYEGCTVTLCLNIWSSVLVLVSVRVRPHVFKVRFLKPWLHMCLSVRRKRRTNKKPHGGRKVMSCPDFVNLKPLWTLNPYVFVCRKERKCASSSVQARAFKIPSPHLIA